MDYIMLPSKRCLKRDLKGFAYRDYQPVAKWRGKT